MSSRRVVALGFLALLAPGLARAHDQSFSELRLAIEPARADLRLTIALRDAAATLGLAGADSLTRMEPAALSAALARSAGSRIEVRADSRRMAIAWKDVAVRSERRAIELHGEASWPRRPGHLAVTVRLFPGNPFHQTFVDVYERGRVMRQEILGDSKPGFEMFTGGTEGTLAVVSTFVVAGMHHIFIGPDHILFLLGLLLLGGGLGRILGITSGFTLAHSITLALATLGVVRPSPRIVEPLIAVSIVFVGLDNLRRRAGQGRDRRALFAFGFGLVHGFGFASVLTSLGLPPGALVTSLFAFNIGVELGQACIVIVALPLLAWVRARGPQAAARTLLVGSAAVAIAGGWWLVERVFLTS